MNSQPQVTGECEAFAWRGRRVAGLSVAGPEGCAEQARGPKGHSRVSSAAAPPHQSADARHEFSGRDVVRPIGTTGSPLLRGAQACPHGARAEREWIGLGSLGVSFN